MSIDEEILSAYVDGELDATKRAEVEAAISSRPEYAQRIARMRATRDQLRNVFDDTLREPVPDRLLKTLASTEARDDSVVANLSGRRDAKQSARTWSWPQWSALAASVAVAAIVGYMLLFKAGGGEMLKQQGNALVADGALARALNAQLASTQSAGGPVRIGLSFLSRSSGRYCRTFVLQERSPSAGLACREEDAWHVRALTPLDGEVNSAGAQQAAASLPPALLAIVQAEVEGAPLDASGERSARDHGWLNRTLQR